MRALDVARSVRRWAFTRRVSISQRVERTSRPRRTCWAGHATCSRIPCLWPVSSPGRTQCLLLGVPPLWRRWAGKTHGVGGMTCALVGSQAGGCQRVRSARAAPRRCVPHVCALASSTRSALPQRARRSFFECWTEFLNAETPSERSEALETAVAPREARPLSVHVPPGGFFCLFV